MIADTRPRILCLHGGGVSARIFECQMRCFIKSLAPYFRLVFMDAPWPGDMHPDLVPVYSKMGPCYRWANWLPHHSRLNESAAIDEVECCLERAMDEDEGAGEWVGLLGFSQGAKVAFSILLENQVRMQDPWARPYTGVRWQFGIIMAGRVPPYSLDPHAAKVEHFISLAQTSQTAVEAQEAAMAAADRLPDQLCTPTLHVHGLQDPGLELHRKLFTSYSSPAHSTLIEWEGAHRIPFKTPDVHRVTEAILEVVAASGYKLPHRPKELNCDYNCS